MKLLVSFFIFLSAYSQRSQAAEIFSWKFQGAADSYILPRAESDSPSNALNKYLREMKSNEELSNLISIRPEDIHNKILFSGLSNSPSSGIRVLLFANKKEDVSENLSALYRLRQMFERTGARVFILPVASVIHLSQEDRSDFYNQLTNYFDIAVPTGGDDIHPSLYSEEIDPKTYNTNLSRDFYEIELIRHLISVEKTFLFSICRGHQLVSAALEMSLIQDISSEVHSEIDHVSSNHSIRLVSTQAHVLEKIWPQGDLSHPVSSRHHQAVDSNFLNPRVTINAQSSDGIIEGFDFLNSKGLSVQYHPEYMGDWGRVFIQNLVHFIRESKRSCNGMLAG